MVALGLAAALALAVLRRDLARLWPGAREHLPLVALAVALGSLPFLVAGRFGILGTGLNPDMSQHLFAADRLAAGGTERLIEDGYPLGPHALVVALQQLGPSPVEAFDGLMLAVAAATCMAAAEALRGLRRPAILVGALVVTAAYLLASAYGQGAFKETMQALFLVAFAVGLAQLARRPAVDTRVTRALAAAPLAALAIGSVYTYSFPGLLWLGGAVGLWAVAELVLAGRRGRGAAASALAGARTPALVAIGLLAVALAPELGRIVSFASFETFDPEGAGLGNLFNRLSPLEALGVWPSGDFRVEPGDGAVPAVLFYVGAAGALAALVFGVAWWGRRRELAVPAALAAAGLLWLYALLAGTPYQESKALVLVAPLVALVASRALLAAAPAPAAIAFCLAAGGSGVLALANAPVGPSGYSPELAELRPELGEGSTVVFAPPELLADQHGRDYLVWELRGNRICVAEGVPAQPPRRASVLVVSLDGGGAVVPQQLSRVAVPPGAGKRCPFIPDGARADPAADG
jgi:hypothetical protein